MTGSWSVTMHIRQNFEAALLKWFTISDARGLSLMAHSNGATANILHCRCASYTSVPSLSRCSNSSTMGSAISKTQTLSEHVRKWMLDRQMFSFVGSSASITFQALKRCHFFIYVLDRRMATRNTSSMTFVSFLGAHACQGSRIPRDYVPLSRSRRPFPHRYCGLKTAL